GLELKRLDQPGRLFFLLALRPFEPAGRLMAHDLGDLAAHVELAGSVGIVIAAKFVPWVFFLRCFGRLGPGGDNDEREYGERDACTRHGETSAGNAQFGLIVSPRRL